MSLPCIGQSAKAIAMAAPPRPSSSLLPRHRLLEEEARTSIHRLVFCDSLLAREDARLSADWHEGRQRLLTTLDTLVSDHEHPSTSVTGHLFLAYQLLSGDDSLSHQGRRSVQHRSKLAHRILKHLDHPMIKVSPPSQFAEEGFVEKMLTHAELAFGNRQHNTLVSIAAKQVSQSFNTMRFLLHEYLAQCVCDLRHKKGTNRYRKVWLTLQSDERLAERYERFMTDWAHFTRLFLQERLCQIAAKLTHRNIPETILSM